MAIGYANKNEIAKHFMHNIEVSLYGHLENLDSATIECLDCNVVLIDSEEDSYEYKTSREAFFAGEDHL